MRFKKTAAVIILAAFILTGCSGISEEMLAERDEGIACMESGDYEAAIEKFEDIISQAERVTDFHLDILKYRAEAEYSLDDYDAAIYTYDLLEQLDGENAQYCYLKAVCYAKAGDTDKAAEQITAGRELEDGTMPGTGYAEAMETIADILSDSGDFSGACVVYEALISAGYDTGDIYNSLMLALIDMRDYEGALDVYEESLALSNNEAAKDRAFNAAVCYEYLGQYDKAISMFESYTDEFGDDERAEHELAFLSSRQ